MKLPCRLSDVELCDNLMLLMLAGEEGSSVYGWPQPADNIAAGLCTANCAQQ